MQIVAVDLLQLPSRFYMACLMGVKNDLIDITDEKTNGIIISYETFDTPASLIFAKTTVHSAEHKLYRIFVDAVQYRENRESLVPLKIPSVRYVIARCIGLVLPHKGRWRAHT